MSPERVDFHLWNWAQWHRRSREHGIGYPSRSAVGENYTTNSDFDSMVEGAYKQAARATDTVIDDLPTLYKIAVYAQHLEGKWFLEDLARALYYRAACDLIGKALDKRGVV